MSFQLDTKEGLASVARAYGAVKTIDEKLAEAEIAMAQYQSALQNDITQEAKNIFERLHGNIDETKRILSGLIENNKIFFRKYDEIVKRGL